MSDWSVRRLAPPREVVPTEPSPLARLDTAVIRPPAIYGDGGLIGRNPSRVGGTYAWCRVNGKGERVHGASGVILSTLEGERRLLRPGDFVLDIPVTNNISEFLALLLALESLPDNWSGSVYSDSRVTLERLFKSASLANLPLEWIDRGATARRRLGTLVPVLLKGHPSQEDLARGYRVVQTDRGPERRRVSPHNHWCDERCSEQARDYLRRANELAMFRPAPHPRLAPIHKAAVARGAQR